MRRFELNIRLGNAAMQTRQDLARALRNVANALEARPLGAETVQDDNGNVVGMWGLYESDDDPRDRV